MYAALYKAGFKANRMRNFIAKLGVLLGGAAVLMLGTLPVNPAMAAGEFARAEAWFNQLKTISADFIQVASDGTAAEGKLYFSRPSRMKIAYDGVNALNLFTTPIWLHVDQPDQRTVTSYPIGETPLSLILGKMVNLRPDGYTTRVLPESAGIMRLEISKDSGQGVGQLTLEFSQKPFHLRRWIIVDSAGIETSVTLQNMVFNQPLANRLFRLPDYDSEN